MSREHAILEKKVINLDHGGSRHVMCGWDDCEKDGVELHKVKINYGTPGNPHIVNVVFCSESHKDYYTRSHIEGQYGRHSPGMRGRIV